MNVVFYTMGDDCPNCNALKKELIKAGIVYEVFDDIDKMIEMGFTEMPMLEVDGKIMKRTDAIKWIKGGRKI